MGCVATLGTDPPPRSCVKCLRADAAARADPGRNPLWTIRREARTMPPLSGGVGWGLQEAEVVTVCSVAAAAQLTNYLGQPLPACSVDRG